MLCRVEREHVRVLRARGNVCCYAGYEVCLADDPVVYSEEGCAGAVEVVHGYYVLVIIGSSDWLVRKVPAVRYGIQVEGAGGVAACRDRDQYLVGADVDYRCEPSSATSVKGDLWIRE